MSDTNQILPTELTAPSELSKKIWKFIIEVATSNENCNHVQKAKELLLEISKQL